MASRCVHLTFREEVVPVLWSSRRLSRMGCPPTSKQHHRTSRPDRPRGKNVPGRFTLTPPQCRSCGLLAVSPWTSRVKPPALTRASVPWPTFLRPDLPSWSTSFRNPAAGKILPGLFRTQAFTSPSSLKDAPGGWWCFSRCQQSFQSCRGFSRLSPRCSLYHVWRPCRLPFHVWCTDSNSVLESPIDNGRASATFPRNASSTRCFSAEICSVLPPCCQPPCPSVLKAVLFSERSVFPRCWFSRLWHLVHLLNCSLFSHLYGSRRSIWF